MRDLVIALFFVLVSSSSVVAQLGPKLKYQSFQKDGEPSPAFVVHHRGAMCLVTSKDDYFPPEKGSAGLFTFEGKGNLPTKSAKVYRQPFTEVFIFGKTKFEAALSYDPDFSIKTKTKVAAISPDGKVDSGFVLVNPGLGEDYRPQMGVIRLMVVTDSEEYKDRLPPGSPVIETSTGKVLGIVAPTYLQHQREPYQASNRFEFEPLCLPTGKKLKPPPVKSLAGLPFQKAVNKEDFRWLFPASLWDYDITNDPKKIERSLVDYKDHQFIMREDTPFLRKIFVIKEDGQRTQRILAQGSNAPDHCRFYKAEKLLGLLLEAFGMPSGFTDQIPGDFNEKGMALVWDFPGGSVTLKYGFDAGVMQVEMELAPAPKKGSGVKRHPFLSKHLVAAPEDIEGAYFAWLKSEWEFAAIPEDRE